MSALMGIVNVTPDSFSDGGQFDSARLGIEHALTLLDQGADIIDVGGESTRPGAQAVSAEVEVARVLPVIRGVLAARPDALISVDTSKATVAAAAIEAGALIVNDVCALADPELGPLCASTGVDVIVMHMRGTPRTMQGDTHYDDLVGEVEAFLLARAEHAQRCGISKERITLDPGIGFGKSLADNPRLIAAVPRLRSHGYRVLIGASRKRFVGELTGVSSAADRVFGSVGAALAAAQHGADVVRVHDVLATRQALTVFDASQPRPAL